MSLLNPVFITGAVEGVTDEIVVRRLIQHVGANTVVVHVQDGKMNLHARSQGYCTAPDFLDTERDAEMMIPALASGEKAAFWGDAEIAAPLIKSPR